MDFSWTQEQVAYRDEIMRFAEKNLNDGVSTHEDPREFPSVVWKRAAEIGIQGLPVPVDFGGGGADPVTIAGALEALGYGCRDNGLVFSLNAHMWSCEAPLVRFGTDEQRKRYLPSLCDGSMVGVQAMTEPDSGSDAYSLRTTARRSADGYALYGSKTFITNAPIADVFVVFASTDRSAGFAGLTAFLIERGTPGLVVGRSLDKMGLRTSPMAELTFEDCRVPDENILGGLGAGMRVFAHSIELERSFILAPAIGAMQRQLERSITYARTRRQYGKPIGRFQAVSHRIVDMKTRLEAARALLYRMAWLRSRGEPAALDASLVKLYISEAYVQSSLDAQQVFGGYGYMTEYEHEREVRDSLASRIYSGTSDIQKNIVARLLGL